MARTTRSSELSAEVRWYLADRGIPLPDCPPALMTPEPSDYLGARFDPDRVDRVLRAFSLLRHTQGEWAGQPLNPDPWQIAYIIAPVFGWVAPDGKGGWTRIIRKLYVEVPRKNGKTTLAGGIAIYMTAADGEPGAQVFAAATGKDQARYCFDPIKTLAEKSPALKPHMKPLQFRIVHKRTGSFFAVVSRIADLLHGANPHASIVDELHLHKSADLIDALETGMGARREPLAVTITTAGSTSETTVYAMRRKRITQLASRALKDPSTFGVIWKAGDTDDPFVEATWRKANPGYGISPTRRFMESAAAEAQQSPTELSKFLRLNLNVRTSVETRWMPMDAWDASAGIVDEAALAAQPCWAGLDLSQTRDLTAFVMVFPTFTPQGEAVRPYRIVPRFWIPEENVEGRSKRDGVPYDVWVEQGLIRTTPGNVIDFDTIERDIRKDALRFAVQEIAFDPQFAWQISQGLQRAGLSVWPFRQGFETMSSPTADMLSLVKQRQLLHGAHAILRWNADNVVVAQDLHGNWRPVKAKSTEKIDGIVAAIMGLDRLQRWIYSLEVPDPQVLVYDERVNIGPQI